MMMLARVTPSSLSPSRLRRKAPAGKPDRRHSSSAAVKGPSCSSSRGEWTKATTTSNEEVNLRKLRNQILQAAGERGLDLSCKWFGPVFRVTASVNCPPEWIDVDGGSGGGDAAPIAVGYISGFTVPLLGYVHFDEMRVLNAELRKIQAKQENASQTVAGAFGTGLLMGMFAMCTFRETGCKTAELLAINDNAYQFRKLVRYYERMGFTCVREVGAGEGESPWYVELGDQLVWGGAGMLMRAQVDDVINQWSRSFK